MVQRPQMVSSDSPEPEETLAGLLDLAARGDEEAFGRLYDHTSRRVYGLVLRVVRDKSIAEEVSQETYLEIWRTSSRYQPELGGCMSWMLMLAHRRAVDRVRAVESAQRRDEKYQRTTGQIDHDSTQETVHTGLEARRVHHALTDLTNTQRQAVELAFFGGYTHNEVAVMLDIPLGTAKTRIRDALIRLRDAMKVGGQGD